MELLIQNALVYTGTTMQATDIYIKNGIIEAMGQGLAANSCEVLDATGCIVSPGFTDLHVHFREPGFTAKETIATGSKAAAAGGFTTVCTMPNLNPVPDSLQNLSPQINAIDKDAVIRVLPYASLTIGQKGDAPADIETLAPVVAGFSDDGRGVQGDAMMLRVMQRVANAGSFISEHCEVEAMLPENGTCVQENCAFALQHGYNGYSSRSEWAEIERDIALAKDTNCRLHICHTSTTESFALVRAGKQNGVAVTCEVTPHNLLLSCDDITEDDGRFKMNPPFRTPADRAAAVEALLDGTVDAIATDHAPHTAEEKSGGFGHAMNGVVGLETAFASVYTGLVLPGTVPLERILHCLTAGPRKVLGEKQPAIAIGEKADLVVLDITNERTVQPETFATMGRSTPFNGWKLRGWPVLTFAAGREVYRR